MSYQVLARKYRPSSFAELAGQEHVLRALVNALDQNRLHHAYLFTGTRGVGKTTIARILARCLNCEQGVSSTPCGECGNCLEISEGRSVDLIEVDAASRTRVEDTRELMDNVQYMPTRSRFKVYLIDEVHMLSNHSFNALLKTLEEPPEHVKFLLATTDPKKLPITVLSRCLQFNLKNMTPEQVVDYLKTILQAESVEYEDDALWQLGRAADGSMRDALSLTDQAIAYGNNVITDADVRGLLGTIDQRQVFELLDRVAVNDAEAVLKQVAHLAEFAPDYAGLLSELLAVLHRVAIAQQVPGAIDNSQGDQALISALAEQMTAEDVQLFYQIGLIGQRDLPYAPEPRSGFEMILLRMLSFTPLEPGAPEGGNGGESGPGSSNSSASTRGGLSGSTATGSQASRSQQTTPVKAILSQLEAKPADTKKSDESVPKAKVDPPWREDAQVIVQPQQPAVASLKTAQTEPAAITETAVAGPKVTLVKPAPSPVKEVVVTEPAGSEKVVNSPAAKPAIPGGISDTNHQANLPTRAAKAVKEKVTLDEGLDWVALLPELALGGVTQTLAANCSVSDESDWQQGMVVLVLNEAHASLWNKNHEKRIARALSVYSERQMMVRIEIGVVEVETPAQAKAREKLERQARAVEEIESDDNIQQLIEGFDGRLIKESIAPRLLTGE